ncbi:MAG: hypothetical protein HOQ29_04120 [Acidobacteria bacterium]|nr:hypothetical protein [Acidobacteriota bacterium]
MKTPTTDESVVAAQHTWAVYQCPQGCLHVRLDNLTLTFSGPQFRRLVELLGEAYVRLGVREAVHDIRQH